MASIRFAGLVIGVIIVSLALKYSSACAHEGSGRKGKWRAGIAPQNHASSKNDLRDNISAATLVNIAGRKGLRGRKMRVDESLKIGTESKLGSDEKPNISGNYASKDSKGAAQNYHLKAQDNSKMSGKPKGKSTRMGLPMSSNSHQDASKAFLDAADDQVVNLMRRDYGGKDRPRRKPPINNHKPTD